jgi:DNA polymerase-3 subunit gamma/tau
MSEQSQTLYRKWRSQTFSDLVGQETVIQTLRQAVAQGRLTHAYLFCGPRGTGKTSTARLLAKMVNCTNPHDGEPCNECLSCREITEGRSTDVFEIDAASNRGIDEIRDLRERVRVMSATGSTRLYIVDECFRYEETVTLADGSRVSIGKLVESEWQGEVLSYNEKTGEIEPKPIVRHMKKACVAPTVRITFDNNRFIVCTINHKFYTPLGQICAGHLEVGQFVYTNRERITANQRAVIMGAALGDGHIALTGSKMRGRLHIRHSVAQKEYLEYKAGLLGNLVGSPAHYDAGIGTYSKTGTFAVTTLSRPEIAEIHRMIYPDGRKSITKELLDQIDVLGLALWYMDDGSLVTAKNEYVRADGTVGSSPSSRSTLSTYAFTLEEVEVILTWLAEKWQIKAHLSNTARGPVIWLTATETRRLHHLIASYVPACMEYKLLPEYRGHFQMPQTDESTSGLAVSIVKNIEQVPAPDCVYNIEVADNHNYFVRDMLVANCHMLTVEAFNALLKTLEEPPPRVIFVLATTEAHKVPATVVSRCQHFEFRRIALRDIIGRLAFVCEQEGMRAEPAALEALARAAQGGMRDALSLLDQARAFGGSDAITAEGVRAMLGMADPTLVRALVGFVQTGDTAAGLHRINEFAASGIDLRQLAHQIAEIWRQLMLARAGADLVKLLDITPDEAADLKALSTQFPLEVLTECARLFARNDAGARVQVVPQLALELAFLDCVATMQGRMSRPQAAPAAPMPVPARPTPEAPPTPPRPQAEPPPATAVAPLPTPITAAPSARNHAVPPDPAPSANGRAAHEQPPTATPPVVREAPAAQEYTTGGTDFFAKVAKEWDMIRKVCKQSSHSIAALLMDAEPVATEPGDPVTVVLAVAHAFHLVKLSEPANRQRVEWSIQQMTDTPCHVKFIPQSDAGNYARPPAPMPTDAPTAPPAAPPAGEAPPVAMPSVPDAAPPRDDRPSAAPPPPMDLAPAAPQPERDALVQALQRDYHASIIEVRHV